MSDGDKRGFALGLHYYIAPSAKPWGECTHGKGTSKCTAPGAWVFVSQTKGGPNNFHGGNITWMCAEHTLRRIQREQADMRTINRKFPEQAPLPIVAVHVGKLPEFWAKEDRRASRELAELQARRSGHQ